MKIILNNFQISSLRDKYMTFFLPLDPSAAQSIILFGSMVASMGLSFIISVISARLLGPSSYGDLKFIQTIWAILVLVITLGYFHSGCRVLVVEKDTQSTREIIGTILIIAGVMAGILILINILIANHIDKIFGSNVASYMMQLIPFIFVLPFAASVPLVLQSINAIYLLSIFQVLPTFLYLICILIISALNKISINAMIITDQLTTLTVCFFIVLKIRPSFRSFKFWWREIRKQNKTYGGPVYRGMLANVASSQINRLAISYWVDNTAIGYYSLAKSLVQPLSFIPNAVATSSFRKFASQKKISKKATQATILASVGCFALAFIFFGKPLSWIYSRDFGPVSSMARVAAFGAILQGFGDFYNRFLGSHGQGKKLQNAAYMMGIVNVVGFVFFVPLFGAWGAIITSVLGGCAYFSFIYMFYKKSIAIL